VTNAEPAPGWRAFRRMLASLPPIFTHTLAKRAKRMAGHPAVALMIVASCPTFAQAPADNPGNWPMAARDYAATRFSPLDQLNASNVGKLTLAWTFSTGVLRGHEAAPIVVDGTMYVITPFPNIVYALDLTQPGAPIKWKFSPNPVSSSQGQACCDVVNRGVA